MSIIYDALKKVEGSGGKAENQEGNSKNKAALNLKAYLLYALVICLGLFAASQLFGYITRSQNVAVNIKKTPAQQVSKPVIKEVAAKEMPAQNEKTPPSGGKDAENSFNNASFDLNGIFFSEKVGFALINNQIVKQGDKISGATVKQITLDGVELDKDGKILRLTTHLR